MEDGRVTRALGVLSGRWNEGGYTVARWATEAGLRVEMLSRLFRRHLATTPRGHLVRTRLSHAEDLLRESDLPIEAVAASCGFANRFHFTRLYARWRRMGPAAYRRLRHELRDGG